MTQEERRRYLIHYLIGEQSQYRDIAIPSDEWGQKRLLRALFNVRLPGEVEAEFLRVQDEYLREETIVRGVIDYRDLRPVETGIYLWQGDITRLRCDGIVNAANSALLGCFCPNHGCIDNAIHTFAGVQLRAACARMMAGGEEPTGRARLTPGFNLPCRYVLHTVGPIVNGALKRRHEEELRACYDSCLRLAEEKGLGSLAFCCISTGEFGFPQRRAAEIAVSAVREYRQTSKDPIEVIFNVFKDSDREIYERLLGKRGAPALGA